MSSSTITPSATYSGASSSIGNLFPTTTTSAPINSGSNSGNPTTYYFVFLGVLVVLLIIAGSLAYRALRIRRQFRTATQIALMRGEPPPRLQDDYWALGVLSPWRVDDAMRAAERDRASGRASVFDADGGFTSRRGGTKVRWDRVPVLWEWEIRDEANGMTTDDEDDSIIEKRAMGVDMPLSALSDAQDTPTSPESTTRQRESLFSSWRQNRARSRTSFLASHIPIHSQYGNPFANVGQATGYGTDANAPSKVYRSAELDREIHEGDDMRTTVIVQMPHEDMGRQDQSGQEEDSLYAWGDAKPGWRAGMELGVWEGSLGSGS